MKEELVQISAKRLDTLLRDEAFLASLETYGVDNWEGYELAQDDYEEWLEEYEKED